MVKIIQLVFITTNLRKMAKQYGSMHQKVKSTALSLAMKTKVAIQKIKRWIKLNKIE